MIWVLMLMTWSYTENRYIATDSGNHFESAAQCNAFWDTLQNERSHYECEEVARDVIAQ